MFAWFSKLFGGSRHRAIFRYHDGKRTRWADPLIIQQQLDEHGGENWPSLLDVIASASAAGPEKLGPALAKEAAKSHDEAARELAQLARKVFGAEPLDPLTGSGLTEWEALGLLAGYLNFLTDLEKKARPSPSSPQPTGVCPADSPTA